MLLFFTVILFNFSIIHIITELYYLFHYPNTMQEDTHKKKEAREMYENKWNELDESRKVKFINEADKIYQQYKVLATVCRGVCSFVVEWCSSSNSSSSSSNSSSNSSNSIINSTNSISRIISNSIRCLK